MPLVSNFFGIKIYMYWDEHYMLPTVIQVKPNDNFTVYVYFSDGKIKLFSMKSIIKRGGCSIKFLRLKTLLSNVPS